MILKNLAIHIIIVEKIPSMIRVVTQYFLQGLHFTAFMMLFIIYTNG